MQRFLLDSSIILDILEANAKGVRATAFISNAEAVTSIICYCEVLNKIDLRKQARAEEFLSKLLIFQLTIEDGRVAKGFQDSCRKSGGFVKTIDCLIAATAANNNAILVASDPDFERIAGIEKKIF